MNFPSKKRLTLANIDFFTEDDGKGPMKFETTIFVTPPQETNNDLPEEDSADENCTEFYLDNLGRKLLCAEAEVYRQGAALSFSLLENNFSVSFQECAKDYCMKKSKMFLSYIQEY